jgi:hypothetical protein
MTYKIDIFFAFNFHVISFTGKKEVMMMDSPEEEMLSMSSTSETFFSSSLAPAMAP